MDPFQERSFQTGSLSGTFFSECILFRNCLLIFRLDPFQELFYHIQSFSGAALTDLVVAPAMSKQKNVAAARARTFLPPSGVGVHVHSYLAPFIAPKVPGIGGTGVLKAASP